MRRNQGSFRDQARPGEAVTNGPRQFWSAGRNTRRGLAFLGLNHVPAAGPARSAVGAVLLLACALFLCPSRADAIRMAAGVYGVYGLPISQEDAGPGPLYGVKARADLAGPLGAEVFYTSYQEGDVTFTTQRGDQIITGGTQDVVGVNGILASLKASGVSLYMTGGVGSYMLSKENRSDLKRIGYNGGFGTEFRSNAGIAIDLSGRLHLVTLEGGGTRKFGALQAGINYYFSR